MTGRTLSHCRLPCLIYVLLVAFFLPLSGRAEKVEQLKPRGYVNDFAGVLDAQAEAQLTALCKEVDQKTRAQIAVVTIRSLEGASLEEFSHQLATLWGVGYKGDNRGVLILLAVTDRRYRIEVGYGLEPILPDGKVGGFGREMVPLLRHDYFGHALLHVTGRVAEVIAADRGVSLTTRPEIYVPPAPKPRPAPPAPRAEPLPEVVLNILLAIIVVALYWLVKASWCTISATFKWIFGGRAARRAGWWGLWTECCQNRWLPRDGGGGGWWGGDGGGGDWGGFGGGDFGGGGASGSW